MKPLQDKALYLKEKLTQQGLEKYDYIDDALDLLHEYDYMTNSIMMVDDDQIEDIISERLESGWQSVSCFLANCDSLNAPFGYRLDGYANLKEITFEDIKNYIDEIINY